MAVLATQTFDAIGNMVELGTSNSSLGGPPWSTVSGTGGELMVTTGAKCHGVNGVRMQNMTGPGDVAWTDPAGVSTQTRVISMYFRVLAAPTGNCYFGGMNDDVAGVSRGDWRVNTDLTVTMRDGTSATGGTSPESLSLNVWYRSEWMSSSSGQELRIYVGEAETPYITRTGTLTNPSRGRLRAGIVAAPNNVTANMDTIRIGDTWVGPFGTPEAPIPTPANFSFVASTTPGTVAIVASADPVAEASSYEVEVDALVNGVFTPLNVFTTTTLPLTLDQTDGLVAGNFYRGRIRALPAG